MAARKDIVYLTGDAPPEGPALYGYAFLFDPFILAACRTLPEMKPIRSFVKGDAARLAVSPIPHYSLSPEDDRRLLKILEAVLDSGGSAAIVQPSPRFYRCLPQLGETRYLRDIASLCEAWRFTSRLCGCRQDYPYREIYQAVDSEGEILSTVGDWPALVLNKKTALFTVNQFGAFSPWRLKDYVPAHANLWVELACRLLGIPVPGRASADSSMELRRDFHSYGLTAALLRELASLMGENIMSSERASGKMILEAARLFVGNRHDSAAEKLAAAFEILYRARLRLADTNIYLVDSAHASTLHGDIGFAEMQWPQWTREYMDYYLTLAEKRGLRLCLDWDASSVGNISVRFPELSARMRRHVEKGSLEFINGGYVQQYPHLWSVQSALQNFRYGRAIFESAVGSPVKTFGGQECCVNPQMPNLLVNSGYEQAIHRIQNFGHVPLVKDAAVMWQGKDGTSIPALPGNPDAAERLGNKFYRNLPLKIFQSVVHGVKDPVFTNMQDMAYREFLEEICRTAYYFPVLGGFTTVGGYFKKHPKGRLPRRRFDCKDYLYGYFYRNHEWRGNENNLAVKSFALENALASGQFLNSLASFRRVSGVKNWEMHWKKTLGLQAHDALIAGNMFTGVFGYQKSSRAGGPIVPSLTNAVKALEGYSRVLKDVRASSARDSGRLYPAGKGIVYINTLGFARKIPAVSADGRDGFIVLPPYGHSSRVEFEEGRVSASENILENDLLAVHMDLKRGCIGSITDKASGRTEVAECNEFVYGEDSKMLMGEFRATGFSSRRAAVRMKGVIRRKGEVLGFYDTRITLSQGSRMVDIRSRLSPAVDIPPDPCRHAFRFKIRLPSAFDAYRAFLNVNEKLAEGRICRQVEEFFPPMSYIFLRPPDPGMKMFNSPHYTRLAAGEGTSVDIMNTGAQWYYKKGDCLYNHLIGRNDDLRDFHYAVSVNGRGHPLLASLDWQTPVITRNSRAQPPWSLFQSSRSNLLLFGAEYAGGDVFILRAAELEGRRTRAVITCGHEPVRVYRSDYRGKFISALKTWGNQFAVNLPAWGGSEYRIELKRPRTRAAAGFPSVP